MDGEATAQGGKWTAHGSIRNAAQVWLKYCEEAETVVHLTHEGFSRVQMMPDLYRALYSLGEMDEEERRTLDDAEWKATNARREAEAGFPIVHAHNLLGLWGALECFVEDFFLAMLDAHPDLLSTDPFKRVRVPAALLSASAEDRNRAILTEATRSSDADLAVGVTKFERVLKMVGLDGCVPERVKAAVFQAQQVRNVWAHRGGLADRWFVERCPSLGFSVGDRVDMAPEFFLSLMHGLHMYGVIVVNRYLSSEDRPTVSPECVGYEGVLAEIAGASGDRGRLDLK